MKIGIFGGCFNPPHKMHKNIALNLINKKYVDKVIYVPTSDNYVKKELISLKHRYNMLKILFKDNSNILISNISQDNKYSYTYEVLDYFKEKFKEDEIYFICGTDNLKELTTWKNYDYILNNYKLLIIDRDKKELANIIKKYQKYSNNIILTDIKTDIISSSIIRKQIKENKDISKDIDQLVYDYILKNKLYILPDN